MTQSCGGLINIESKIIGEYDDSDALCLVDACLMNPDMSYNTYIDPGYVYLYDYFEFIAPPIASSERDTVVSKNTLKMSNMGGSFYVLYIRKTWPSNVPIMLAHSSLIQIPGKILSISLSSNDGVIPGRRSVGDIKRLIGLKYLVEDLMNIGVVSLTFQPLASSTAINRVSAWLVDNSSSKIIIETNQWNTNVSKGDESSDPSNSSIIYGVAMVDGERYSFLPDKGTVQLLDNELIICRLPYDKANSKQLSSNSNDADKRSDAIKTLTALNAEESESICCRFCDHIILPLNSIQDVKPLPTGLFDDVRDISVV